MEHDTAIPPPKSLADQLREIPVGASAFFEEKVNTPTSIRSTLTRVKKADPTRDYTSRPEGDGLRVWRLS